jgi:hypothetical protein
LIATIPSPVLCHRSELSFQDLLEVGQTASPMVPCPPAKIPLSAIRPVEWADVEDETEDLREQEEIEQGFF